MQLLLAMLQKVILQSVLSKVYFMNSITKLFKALTQVNITTREGDRSWRGQTFLSQHFLPIGAATVRLPFTAEVHVACDGRCTRAHY